MQPNRREILQHLGWLGAVGAGADVLTSTGSALGSTHAPELGPVDGVLVDLSACIGCRLCEFACRKSNGIEPGPIESYDDPSVFAHMRRPGSDALTVVNAFPGLAPADPTTRPMPVHAKINCMHCNQPACVSACIVGALRKKENGAVTYDEWKCIGCRYCMVACPFQLPAYSYEDVLTPRVRKCQFCYDERTSKGQTPACVEACPRQAMTFGKRSELLELAKERIAEHPERYVDHLYGEHEIGGTSWMYLSPVPFAQAGFIPLGNAAPPVLTEAIQHGVFKYWIAPVGWYSFLSAMYWWTGRREKARQADEQAKTASRQRDRRIESSQPRLAAVAHAESEGMWDGGGVAVLEELEDEEGTDEGTQGQRDEGDERHGGTGARRHEGEEDQPEHGHGHAEAAPIPRPFFTPGVMALLAIMLIGIGFWMYRMTVGLAASTNLDQQHPWGLWIAMDVGSGIALAGGGFIAAAIFHIFHRHRYHMLARSALLTALLGYTFYVPGLLADLGRWYKLPITMLPPMWQGNSVLFEVGMCVMIYLNVQYAELTPILCERIMGTGWTRRRPRLNRLICSMQSFLNKIMPALLILGVTLSTFHQSSLGNLMNIAPYKLHHLWWGAFSPVHFLLSAAMVGLPMVIFTILFASWSLRREPEMQTLAPLAKHYVPVFIGIYLVAKVGDMIARGTYSYLGDGSRESALWIAEMLLGVVVPLVLFLIPAVRRSPRWLGTACLMVIFGVVLNRLNVFIFAYHPPYAEKTYFPSITEFAVSAGLVAAMMLVYRLAVTYLPILEPRPMRKPA